MSMSLLTFKGPFRTVVRLHRHTLWALAALTAVCLAAVAALRSWAGPAAESGPPNEGWRLLQLGMQYTGTGLLFLPVLVGAFAAGPLTARELESGTWRLALTQSSGPRAWLGARVLVAATAAALASAVLVGIYRLGWARVPNTHQLHWADRGTYEATGPVLVAYCLLGVALGVLVGQLVRRTLAAMAVTGLLTSLAVLGFGSLRWSILPTQTNTLPYPGRPFGAPGSALVTDSGLLTGSGERLPYDACFARTKNLDNCPADMNITARYTEFHPASHHWPTQLIETSLALSLAVIALWAAFRLARTGRA
ncbi:ABC transporter permease [Streptomyces sp. NPDC032472]|uniref:ABC transporter permease subunit n=1 Tax=Streptomyces sp. NPDC032472 TaxID=3155018 RepID=UPI0033E10A25